MPLAGWRSRLKRMVEPEDRLVLVVALGHGADTGHPHPSKSEEDVTSISEGTKPPAWFKAGISSALLTPPTSTNQQGFKIGWCGRTTQDATPVVSIRSKGGPFSTTDLSIILLHFEIDTAALSGYFV